MSLLKVDETPVKREFRKLMVWGYEGLVSLVLNRDDLQRRTGFDLTPEETKSLIDSLQRAYDASVDIDST